MFVSQERSSLGGSEVEFLVAMQPDQGGRKLLFLSPGSASDGGGRILGFVELETLSGEGAHVAHADDAAPGTSVLRGMLVEEGCRGRGYARTFLATWLWLCERAGVTPATSRINKPLMALTLVRLGFTPLRGRDKPGLRGKPGRSRKAKQQPLAVEVSAGSEGSVVLYCSTASLQDRLRAGFTAQECRSQRLVVATEPPLPRGRVAHIRVRYAPPATRCRAPATASVPGRTCDKLVHTPLAEAAIGGRLRLSAAQGPNSGPQTAAARAEVLRLLTGRLDVANVVTAAAVPPRGAAVAMCAASTNSSSLNASIAAVPTRGAPCKAGALRDLGGPGAQRPKPTSTRRVSDLFRPDRLGRGSALDGGGTEGTRW